MPRIVRIEYPGAYGLMGEIIILRSWIFLIWKETTASQKMLAENLFMSSPANVSQILRRWKQKPLEAKLPPKLQEFMSEYAA